MCLKFSGTHLDPGLGRTLQDDKILVVLPSDEHSDKNDRSLADVCRGQTDLPMTESASTGLA